MSGAVDIEIVQRLLLRLAAGLSADAIGARRLRARIDRRPEAAALRAVVQLIGPHSVIEMANAARERASRRRLADHNSELRGTR
jgi:hypothetical protein